MSQLMHIRVYNKTAFAIDTVLNRAIDIVF